MIIAWLPRASSTCVTSGVDEKGWRCHLITSVLIIGCGSLQFLGGGLAAVVSVHGGKACPSSQVRSNGNERLQQKYLHLVSINQDHLCWLVENVATTELGAACSQDTVGHATLSSLSTDLCSVSIWTLLYGLSLLLLSDAFVCHFAFDFHGFRLVGWRHAVCSSHSRAHLF